MATLKNNKKVFLEKETERCIGNSDKPRMMTVNSVDISKFKIIYAKNPAGLDKAADRMMLDFKNFFGVKLPCCLDVSTKETEYEILIGTTNRRCSRVQATVELMSYRCIVENNKLMLLCGGAYSAMNAVEYFFRFIQAMNLHFLNDGILFEKNMLKVSTQGLTPKSDLRVMTSNVLADCWLIGKRPFVEQRAEIYAAMLAVYAPGLVGVQETDHPWLALFPYYLNFLKRVYGKDYHWIEYGDTTKPNLTSVLYCADRFTLLESAVQDFSFFNKPNYRLRVLTHGVFRDDAGRILALVNTHWSCNPEDVVAEIQEEKALLDKLKVKYGDIIIFCTGDFNHHMNHGAKAFADATCLNDSKALAKENGTLVNEFSGISDSTIYIDHIYTNLSSDAIKRYETVNVNYAKTLSDHCPQYGDFKLP